jgi:hypothetical protein
MGKKILFEKRIIYLKRMNVPGNTPTMSNQGTAHESPEVTNEIICMD